MTWRPQIPERFVCAERTSENGSVFNMFFAVESARVAGDQLHFTAVSVPGGLLADKPMPYLPPGQSRSTSPDGFRYWWQLLTYALDLPDPRLFPSTSEAMQEPQLSTAKRFMSVTDSLARSSVLSYQCEMRIAPEDDGDGEVVEADFPPADAQAGFAALVRQCNKKDEAASYSKVHDILWLAAQRTEDGRSVDRQHLLQTWSGAVKTLKNRSIDQLVRDKLVRDEGCGVLDWREPRTPDRLMDIFNYGDLLHWGNARDRLSSAPDKFTSMRSRLDFLRAAVGLAHLYIGFGALVRAAIHPCGQLLLP